jgi:AcrR family transcriptional regulator
MAVKMDDDTLDVLWGRRSRPRRGPKPGLSLDGVVQAAIALADAEGLGQLSMSRVAERLGFTTMSIYRYVKRKDDLLLLMVDGAATNPPRPDPDDWRAGLREWSRAMLDSYRLHPWTLQIPISGPPVGPNQLAWMDAGLHCLSRVELHEAEKLGVIQLVSGYVRAQALLSSELSQAAKARTAPVPTYGAQLRKVVTAHDYPALHRLVESGFLDGPTDYDDRDFEFGLDRVLDGVAALIDR